MAQEKYGFFNSSGDDTRSYEASDMADAFHTLASDGVAELNTCLQVTAEGSTMRTLVGYGTAMIQGYYYKLRDDGSGTQAFTHTTEEELNRIDRIILRLDLTERTIAIAKLIGTAAATPEAPALTQDDETYEISLAQVLVQAGAAEILSTDITDERADDDVCGLIAPESLRRSEIEQMIEDAIDEATDDVLRYTEQTLETETQTQVRDNMNAQETITAEGILKGDGAGGVTAAVAGTDYAGLDSSGRVSAELTMSDIVSPTESFTLALEHAGTFIRVVSSSAVTITLPHNEDVAFQTGTEIEVCQWGTGTVTFAAGTDVTIRSLDSMTSTSGQYACVALKRIFTNTWLLTGALA